jgi:hypothetical protein
MRIDSASSGEQFCESKAHRLCVTVSRGWSASEIEVWEEACFFHAGFRALVKTLRKDSGAPDRAHPDSGGGGAVWGSGIVKTIFFPGAPRA